MGVRNNNTITRPNTQKPGSTGTLLDALMDQLDPFGPRPVLMLVHAVSFFFGGAKVIASAEGVAIQGSGTKNGQLVSGSSRKRMSRGEHAPELLLSSSTAIERGTQDTGEVFRRPGSFRGQICSIFVQKKS